MSPIMRKIFIVAASILVCVAAAAQEQQHHQMSDAEFLKVLGEMSVPGTKSTVATGVTVTVAPAAKPLPLSVKVVPPLVGPVAGETELIDGAGNV